MADAVAAALESLGLRLERLTQGLRAMLDAQKGHTAMLQELLQTAAEPLEPERRLGDLLAEVAAALGAQTTLLGEVKASLRTLPADVGEAVGRSVRDALRDV